MNRTSLTSIVVFVSQYESAFLDEFLEELASACGAENLRMQVYRTQKDDHGSDALRRLNASPAEVGVVILGLPQRIARDLAVGLSIKKYRSVTIDTLVPGAPNSYVGTDNARGVRIGMDHLMALGHRRILYLVNEPEEAETVRSRIRAFHAVVSEFGLEGSREFYCGTQFWEDSFEMAYRRMPEIWGAGAAYTAIFTTSDPGAKAALKWFSENDVAVPGRVSVMGFDDEALGRVVSPGLTTIGHKTAEMSIRAVESLISGSDVQIFVPPALIVRQSTGPALNA